MIFILFWTLLLINWYTQFFQKIGEIVATLLIVPSFGLGAVVPYILRYYAWRKLRA